MTESLDPSVTETPTPEAVPPVRAVDSEDAAALKRKLDLVQQDSRTKGETNKALKTELEEMRRDFAAFKSQQKQAKLVGDNDFRSAYEDLKKSYDAELLSKSELVKQLEDERAGRQQQTIQQQAMAALQQAGAISPEDAYKLYQDKFKLDENGSVVAWDGGVPKQLNEFASGLKDADTGRAYLFNSSGARGMSAVGSSSQGSGESNPYLTGNFMAVCDLEASDPQRAAQLKAQAGK